MENSNSSGTLNNFGLHGKLNQNETRKNGLRLSNDMSQTVCLFRKYLLARSQHNIGKTNMEESEVLINKSPCSPSLTPKFSRKSLFRPPSLLERKLFPEFNCDSVKSNTSFPEINSSSTTQLTVFYNGGVNVYDNVSAEKAQEIMLILDGQNSTSKPFVREASKTDVKSPPNYMQPLHKSKAVPPLARKYSLQCFIEKRRDRIISKSPYAAAVASSPSSGKVTEHRDKETKMQSELKENRCPTSLSPFPSRLGYFFPVSANKGC